MRARSREIKGKEGKEKNGGMSGWSTGLERLGFDFGSLGSSGPGKE